MQKALLILACVACTSTATPASAPASAAPEHHAVHVGTTWPKIELTNLADQKQIDATGKG